MDVLCLPEGHPHDNRILICAHSGHSDTSLHRTPPLGAHIVAWAYPAVIQELRRLKKEYWTFELPSLNIVAILVVRLFWMTRIPRCPSVQVYGLD
jgi:hypothetical protein